MKYIRTKDGRILKVFKENVCLLGNDGALTYYGENTIDFKTSYFLSKTGIIKQADTIEELCDEFIIKVKDTESEEYGYLIIDKLGGYEKVLSLNKQAQENGAIIYGAIWTDKGLIYVAKMNEKGELELL